MYNVYCNAGFSLVGSSVIQCRAGLLHTVPVTGSPYCTGITNQLRNCCHSIEV